MVQNTSANTYGTAKWIVSSTASNGTHTTIASALTSASSGDTIFIRPGTYTEDLTLKAGINLCAFAADAYTPNVVILGKCTATFAGTCSISGIQLKTNSDFCLAVTGTLATIVNLKGCFIDANNSTAISFTTSSGSAKIQLYDCKGNIDTTGISYFTHSSAGALKFFGGTFENDGASTTAATSSGSGGLNLYNCYFGAPFTTSSTSALSMNNVQFQSPIIVNGTGSNFISNSTIVAGSSSAISVGTGATLTLTSSTIDSTNTNAITGAGTIVYAGIIFSNSSSTINTTTKTAKNASEVHQVNIQTFTGNGTYTPTVGMKYCIIECLGGGAGGGGVTGASGQSGSAGGGGSGSYARKISSAATIGTSQAVTVGGGGNGGTAGNNNGSVGSDTSVGSICIGKGGSGGGGVASGNNALGGTGGVAGTGDFVPTGNPGGSGAGGLSTAYEVIGGPGGCSVFGGGGKSPVANNTTVAGINATNYGSGGSGAASHNVTSNAAGGNGSAGVVIITEFI